MEQKEVKKQWTLRSSNVSESTVEKIIDKYKLSRSTAELISSRFIGSEDDIDMFINKDCSPLRDPLLLNDMDKAVERILRAVKNKDDVVAIYGDYDVDGVTSVSMMYLYLTSLGLRVGYYIPSRNDEGYGINKSAINKLYSRGVTLIISVDTGVTAIDEVEYAKSLGIDMIITDHHECRPELPDALAVINPHRPDCDYPFKELAGVGVAFKLICALEVARICETGLTEYEAQRKILLEYGDLVAIGTVADVMPIVDENRTIVSMGLKIIEARPRLGLSSLIELSSNKSASAQKKDITSTFIGFTIAPRLNAAGRMGNAAVAVELLLAEDKQTATTIAEELCETNRIRQSEENKIVDAALEKIDEEWDLHIKNGGVIVLAGEDWQQGVIGIVASRITERFGMPSILISFDGSVPLLSDESPFDLGKGSGRSVKGFNLVTALAECDELLEKYGGHELAAGLSIKRGNLDAFRERLNQYSRPILNNLENVQIIEADKIVSADELTLTFANELSSVIEPCGQHNPVPAFIMTDVMITSVRGIGAGKHIKLTIEKDGKKFTCLWFGVAESQNRFKVGDLVDMLFTLSINHFNDSTELQLIVTDIRYAEKVYAERVASRDSLKRLLCGGAYSPEDDYLPQRSDFVAFYRLFLSYVRDGRFSISDSNAAKLFAQAMSEEMPNFVKYRLMLEVFNELDIFHVEYIPLVSDSMSDRWQLPEDICVITRGSAEKVNLDDSILLARLREQITQ